MKRLAYLLGFTFVWVALAGRFSWIGVGIGLLLAVVVVRVERVRVTDRPTPRRVLRAAWALARLTALFTWEIFVANLEQLRIILQPRIDITPRWFRYSTRLTSPGLQAALGVLISMTPGTITCDIDPSRRVVLVHGLTVSNLEATTARIAARLEGPLLDLEEA